MRLHTVTAVVVLAAAVACSSPDRARRMSPTAPTAGTTVGTGPMGLGGISGPMDVLFPSRADAFEFRNQLETKYQTGLNRSASLTSVDREGEVVWVQEYIRYRVNGCDHLTATERVMAQIDGNPPGGICAENRDFVILFPPRDQILDFRRQLETKYLQSLARGPAPTFVDIEGSVIWTQEYLRYRVNECDHNSAVQKVMAQIDGGAVADTCVPACRYRAAPGDREVSDGQQTNSFDLVGEPGGCAWTASSDASWLTFPSDLTSGTNSVTIPYTVLQNVSGGPRIGRIRFAWAGGGAAHTIFQAGSALISSFTMTDSFRSGGSPATECHFRSMATPCTFTATDNFPGGNNVYTWTATYFYGTEKTTTQTSASNQFTITDACSGTDSTASGNHGDLTVTVTITDSAGNSQTITSGQGMQPALRIVRFTC
jgi:hypothetical protein